MLTDEAVLRVIRLTQGTQPPTTCSIASLLGASTCEATRFINDLAKRVVGLHRVEHANAEAWVID